MKPRCAPIPVRLRRGFTLVEIMVAVVILGVLIAIAVPTSRRFQRKAQNTTFANNLRIFTQVFETYAMRNGTWPPITDAGLVPIPMRGTGEIREDNWTAPSLGGQWKWTYQNPHPKAFISIVGVTVSEEQMNEIDALIDGIPNLNSGNFQGSGTTYMFILQN
jgi:prepilin-type N-terminal cleavage/methylation domain-containing protein